LKANIEYNAFIIDSHIGLVWMIKFLELKSIAYYHISHPNEA